jgi:hypothetical protein
MNAMSKAEIISKIEQSTIQRLDLLDACITMLRTDNQHQPLPWEQFIDSLNGMLADAPLALTPLQRVEERDILQ